MNVQKSWNLWHFRHHCLCLGLLPRTQGLHVLLAFFVTTTAGFTRSSRLLSRLRLDCGNHQFTAWFRLWSALYAESMLCDMVPAFLCGCSDATYLLLYEALQLLVAASSSQLFMPIVTSPTGNHPMLEAVLQQQHVAPQVCSLCWFVHRCTLQHVKPSAGIPLPLKSSEQHTSSCFSPVCLGDMLSFAACCFMTLAVTHTHTHTHRGQ